MRFNCPECATPHEFDDSHIPHEGIVVACTRCSAHITLNKQGVVTAEPVAPVEPEPAPEPPAPSPPPSTGFEGLMATAAAQGALDVGVKPTTEQAASKLPIGPPPERTPEPEPEPEPEAPKDEKAGLFGAFASAAKGAADAAASAAKDAADVAGRAFDEAAAERMSAEVDVPKGLQFPGFSPAEGVWTWKDLPRAFMGVMDLRRLGFTIAGFWAALVAFGLVRWLGGFLGNKVWGPLGSIFDVAAWVVFVGGAAVVVSVASYVVYATIIEQRATSVREGINWTKGRLKAVIGTPLAFAAVVLGAGVAEGLVGLLGRIPFAGPIVWGVASPAIWLLSIAAGLVAVAAAYSLPLYVPIIYTENTDAKATLQRLAALFKAQGSRLFSYLLLSAVTIGFAYFATLHHALGVSAKLTMKVGDASMGENFMATLASVPGGFGGVFGLMPAGGAGADGIGFTIGGWFAGFGLLIPEAVLLATVGLSYLTAGAIVHAIVTGRKKA